MSKARDSIIGFFLFFVIIAFNCSVALLVYAHISKENHAVIALVILIFLILSALLCTAIDTIRRHLTITKPVEEIKKATKKMAAGDFNVSLNINKYYSGFNALDDIKEDLNVLAKELAKNEILKSDFISNVSHELKTPSSVILNYSQLIQNENLSQEKKQKYLTSIKEASIKLNNLVTNVLKLNKLENQELNIECKEFNLSESIIEQILLYEDKINEKHLSMICNIEENVFINSEQSYLEIIWNNLISNAIKFSFDSGKIEINLNKESKYIIFSIIDYGCGLDSNTGSHIFDKFYQGDTSHHKEGNGLGLALVKKVIDVLGGEISVESELNKGTKFTVILKENNNG